MGPQEVELADALQRIEDGAPLIDVREQSEWDEVHAPQATLLPMSELQARWAEVPADDEHPAVVVCHSGYRSAQVVAALERAGVPAVSLAGGMVAWEQSGAPVVRPGRTPAADGERGHEH
ncbi:rhodanese-like domain-containing protein [Curtobacterium sp. MCJR17_055]|uniref:rhodanese-like domain-containing protein n=1 Tax=unclassified Curtobacterium TaxID=257496 RepID=UPI000D9221B6|nr:MULTISPECIES: rhodanese-like domain-containing protein [unclassified Curtobacterium]PYY35041.1 rhodanese-like domain-containing protein [Curtobacterium sp. MCBD17_029]PYY42423.1 rhodanese-like domain-containing protein [Curtobacterium sp. MCPF17_046]PYY55679.1 rhodanese-like domain-containing protein [Curtobacterium sp. MCJR17_055]PYY60424.1 rhodanese-like domain-containing protein [Curtobacterium sp. MCPF17_015]PZE90911.1 rhodanese-like domain-containing protein [Curtobacterium sp. MCBD17_